MAGRCIASIYDSDVNSKYVTSDVNSKYVTSDVNSKYVTSDVSSKYVTSGRIYQLWTSLLYHTHVGHVQLQQYGFRARLFFLRIFACFSC